MRGQGLLQLTLVKVDEADVAQGTGLSEGISNLLVYLGLNPTKVQDPPL